jgi:hypothetical protein
MKKVRAFFRFIKALFSVHPKAKYYGHIRVYPGQRLFEFNFIEGEIEFATMTGKKSSRDTYVEFEIKDNCKYAPAINIEGACKKFGLNVKINRG